MPSPSGSTPKYGFPYLLETDAPDVATASEDLAVGIEDVIATYAQGVLSSRPSAGLAGRYYYATDTAQLFYDDGTAWLDTHMQSTSLFGVGAAASGGTPPARLTGQFFKQCFNAALVYSSGFVAVTFPHAFPGGCMGANCTLTSGTNPGQFVAYSFSTTGFESVLYIGGSAYTGGADVYVEATGW